LPEPLPLEGLEARMESIPKCLLLQIDATEESLRPVRFLGRLYPDAAQTELILSYFQPPLPPVYKQYPLPPSLVEKRKELLRSREIQTRSVLDRARTVLKEAGFSEDKIQEHVQERESSVARHACSLADRKKVDAVLVQRHVCRDLEDFLKDDPTDALLHHCQVSPVWIADGEIDPGHTAVCIQNEDASLRAVDHAAFMLAESPGQITILHVARSVSRPIESGVTDYASEFLGWLNSPGGAPLKTFFDNSRRILREAKIQEDRVRLAVHPISWNVADTILGYCRERRVGVTVLGHSGEQGILGFLRGSVTKRILSEFKNMAVWVTQ